MQCSAQSLPHEAKCQKLGYTSSSNPNFPQLGMACPNLIVFMGWVLCIMSRVKSSPPCPVAHAKRRGNQNNEDTVELQCSLCENWNKKRFKFPTKIHTCIHFQGFFVASFIQTSEGWGLICVTRHLNSNTCSQSIVGSEIVQCTI